jgi:golgi to ER traffic protein 4
LLIGNVRDATKALQIFTSKLADGPNAKGLGVQEVASTNNEVKIYTSLPLLNFIALLLLALQRGQADLFRDLKRQYAEHLSEVGMWEDALNQIAEMYFGIKVPRQSNPLMDMLGGMFGGGAGPAPQPKSRRVEAAPPSAPGLD